MSGGLTTSELMRGGCYALARHLASATGLPVWGLADEAGLVHHAFAYDEVEGRAYDARGGLSLATVGLVHGRRCAGRVARPVTEAELLELEGEVDFRTTRRGLAGDVRRTPDPRELVDRRARPTDAATKVRRRGTRCQTK